MFINDIIIRIMCNISFVDYVVVILFSKLKDLYIVYPHINTYIYLVKISITKTQTCVMLSCQK